MKFDIECPHCCHQFDFETEYESREYYGADADGNRGMWLPERQTLLDDVVICPECKGDVTPYAEEIADGWEPPGQDDFEPDTEAERDDEY